MNVTMGPVALLSIFSPLLLGCGGSAMIEPTSNERGNYSEKIQHVRNVREDWTVVRIAGDTLANVTIDSLGADGLAVRIGGVAASIHLDSIAVLSQTNPPVGLSSQSMLTGLAGAIVGGIIFWNNKPDQAGVSVSSVAFVYGMEFAGAMLVGAIAGLGVGYLIDLASTRPETFGFTGESRLRKQQIIGELMSEPQLKVGGGKD